MTSRFLKQSLMTASVITIAASILSRPFGYLREAVIASYFGTGSQLETFLLAITIPELVAAVVYAAVPTAIIPALRSSSEWSEGCESRLFWKGFAMLIAALGTLSLAVFLLRADILAWLAPTLESEAADLGRHLMAILAGLILFRGLEAYFRGWLHKYKHFLGPALSPFILNAVLLGSILLLYGWLDIRALAFGWLAGTAMLFMYNGLLVWRVVAPGLTRPERPVSMSPLMRLILAVGIVEAISFLYPAVDRAIAARFLSEGQIAALRYSFYLTQLPPGILVVTFSLASFPWITDLSISTEFARLRDLYRQSVGLIVFAMLPVVVGMVMFAPEIVQVAFQRGVFDAHSSELTTGPFVFYSLGLLFYSVYIYQMRYYYARRLMLRLGAILITMLVVKIVGSFLLVGPFEHEGLAMATTLAWVAGLVLMTVDLGRVTGLSLSCQSVLSMVKMLIAATVTGGFWFVTAGIWPTESIETLTGLFLYLALIGLAGLALYLGLAYLFGMDEPRQAVQAVRNGFKSNGMTE